jgi:hypothetical protein
MSCASYLGVVAAVPFGGPFLRGVRLDAVPRFRAGLLGGPVFANEPPLDPPTADPVPAASGAATRSVVTQILPEGGPRRGGSPDPEGPSEPLRPNLFGLSGRTTTRTCRTVSLPNVSFARRLTSERRNRTCAAHAGVDAATTSTPPSRARGAVWAASWGPTTSSQPRTRRPRETPRTSGPCPSASRRIDPSPSARPDDPDRRSTGSFLSPRSDIPILDLPHRRAGGDMGLVGHRQQDLSPPFQARPQPATAGGIQP